MAILKIARMGHPVLARTAEPVADPASPGLAALIEDMVETLADIGGRGLAAPQVHVPLRLVIFLAPGEGADGSDLVTLINPEITPLAKGTVDGWEGCLSVPGLRGLVPRWTRIRYRGLSPAGLPIDRIAEGFHARVVQHECDHLDGVLYPRRMTDLGKLVFESEMRWQPAPPDDDDESGEEMT
ncbi:MAG: peptide deformylase [Alphaproteobacteria bacterium]|nr:peptide deformylase [Alphaproteobacteria bacterium]